MTKYELITHRINVLMKAVKECRKNGNEEMELMFTGFLNALIYKRSIMTIYEADLLAGYIWQSAGRHDNV